MGWLDAREMLEGVEHLVRQVSRHQGDGKQGRDVGIEPMHQPPCDQHADTENHHEPGGKQDDTPIFGSLVMHRCFREKAVVIPCMPLVEQA